MTHDEARRLVGMLGNWAALRAIAERLIAYIAANEQAEREHERMGQVAIEAYNAVLAKLHAAESRADLVHRRLRSQRRPHRRA